MFAPDGKSIVYASYVGNYPGIDAWQLERYWIKSGKRQQSSMFDSPFPGPDISPDGRLIAFTASTKSGSAIRLTRRLGDEGWTLPAPVPSVAPTFSPNGRKIAYLSRIDGTWQVMISSVDGTQRRQLSEENTSVTEVAFSPDGSQVAYQVSSFEQSQIVKMDLRTRGRTVIEFPEPFLNLKLTEWIRNRLFRVLAFKPNAQLARVEVFGPGSINVLRGASILGRKRVARGGVFNVPLRPSAVSLKKVRVLFRPLGALPGSVIYPQTS